MEKIINFYTLPFTEHSHAESMNASYNTIEHNYINGYITRHQYRWAMLFWGWSCAKFESKAQDRCFNAFGYGGILKRVARVKKIQQDYLEKYFTGHLKMED